VRPTHPTIGIEPGVRIMGALDGRTVNALGCWPMVRGSSPSLGKTPTLKTVIQLQGLQYEKLSCTIPPGSMSLLYCEIYQRGRVSRVADTELVLLIAQLIGRRMSYVQSTTTKTSD